MNRARYGCITLDAAASFSLSRGAAAQRTPCNGEIFENRILKGVGVGKEEVKLSSAGCGLLAH